MASTTTGDASNSLNYIRFDVGHQLFTCHRNTILASGDSVLSKFISPDFDKRRTGLDYIVIDRDGKHFGAILNYLRDPRGLKVETFSDDELDEFLREVDYYCILPLLNVCEKEKESRTMRKSMKSMQLNEAEKQTVVIPENRRIEVIFDCDILLRIMQASKRRVIIISYKNIKRFHIDYWFEDLVKHYCDFGKNVVYYYSGETQLKLFTEFIFFCYDPKKRLETYKLRAPDTKTFQARRERYKTKIYKHWFGNQHHQ